MTSIRSLDSRDKKPRPRTLGYRFSVTKLGIQVGEHDLTERQLAELIHWAQMAQRFHIANRKENK